MIITSSKSGRPGTTGYRGHLPHRTLPSRSATAFQPAAPREITPLPPTLPLSSSSPLSLLPRCSAAFPKSSRTTHQPTPEPEPGRRATSSASPRRRERAGRLPTPGECPPAQIRAVLFLWGEAGCFFLAVWFGISEERGFLPWVGGGGRISNSGAFRWEVSWFLVMRGFLRFLGWAGIRVSLVGFFHGG